LTTATTARRPEAEHVHEDAAELLAEQAVDEKVHGRVESQQHVRDAVGAKSLVYDLLGSLSSVSAGVFILPGLRREIFYRVLRRQ